MKFKETKLCKLLDISTKLRSSPLTAVQTWTAFFFLFVSKAADITRPFAKQQEYRPGGGGGGGGMGVLPKNTYTGMCGPTGS